MCSFVHNLRLQIISINKILVIISLFKMDGWQGSTWPWIPWSRWRWPRRRSCLGTRPCPPGSSPPAGSYPPPVSPALWARPAWPPGRDSSWLGPWIPAFAGHLSPWCSPPRGYGRLLLRGAVSLSEAVRGVAVDPGQDQLVPGATSPLALQTINL